MRVVLLDTGPLGLVTHPNAATKNAQAARWLRDLLTAGIAVRVPEICDYELRRELLRAGKARSISREGSVSSPVRRRRTSSSPSRP